MPILFEFIFIRIKEDPASPLILMGWNCTATLYFCMWKLANDISKWNTFAMPSTIYYDLDSSSKGAQKFQINLTILTCDIIKMGHQNQGSKYQFNSAIVWLHLFWNLAIYAVKRRWGNWFLMTLFYVSELHGILLGLFTAHQKPSEWQITRVIII